MKIEGVWLPIITPFIDNEIDYKSYQKMIDYYIEKGITGIIPLGTTGESPVLNEKETIQLIEKTIEYSNGHVPIFVGTGGNYTDKVVKQVKQLEKYDIEGILSVCPYYNRPDQRGIFEHFKKIAENTSLKILIYNIPYRTGRNIENKTLYKLAEFDNIVGVKDSCGDIKQTLDLLLNKPAGFSVLTGEDILYLTNLVHGGDGGILASAHLKTADYITIYNLLREDKHQEALPLWEKLYQMIPLLFQEPNPAPVKYCLKEKGLISSAETRLPIVGVSEDLKKRLAENLKI